MVSLSQLEADAFAGDPTESLITAHVPLAAVLSFLDSTILDTMDDSEADWAKDEVKVTALVIARYLYSYKVEGKALVSALRKAHITTSDDVHDYLAASEITLKIGRGPDDARMPSRPAPGHVASPDSAACPETGSDKV